MIIDTIYVILISVQLIEKFMVSVGTLRPIWVFFLNTPLSILTEQDDPLDPELQTSNKYGHQVRKFHNQMKTSIRRVRENAELDYRYAKNHHDRNLHGPYFKENDLCYMLIQCPKHKYSPRWRGPLRVIRPLIENNKHLYVIEIAPSVHKVVNISKLKHFTPRNALPTPIDTPAITPAKNAHSTVVSNAQNVTLTSTANRAEVDASDDEDEDEFVTIARYTPVISSDPTLLTHEKEDIHPNAIATSAPSTSVSVDCNADAHTSTHHESITDTTPTQPESISLDSTPPTGSNDEIQELEHSPPPNSNLPSADDILNTDDEADLYEDALDCINPGITDSNTDRYTSRTRCGSRVLRDHSQLHEVTRYKGYTL